MPQYDPHRWSDHLFDVDGTMVREISGRVTTCVLWSFVVLLLDWFLRPYGYQFHFPEVAHALVGGAISLLLVFRTNASYDRFWEGRKLWGGIVNETRNFIRLLYSYAPDAPSLRTAALWTIVFPYACMHRLRGKRALGAIAAKLPAEEVDEVMQKLHLPLAVARKLTVLVDDLRREGRLTDIQQMQIDANIQLLIDYIGACERIRSTPLPYAYAVHLRRALFLYCLTLPFALIERLGGLEVIATAMITYTLFGIEEIGVEIEEPFGEDLNDLPLESICENIELTLRDAAQLEVMLS